MYKGSRPSATDGWGNRRGVRAISAGCRSLTKCPESKARDRRSSRVELTGRSRSHLSVVTSRRLRDDDSRIRINVSGLTKARFSADEPLVRPRRINHATIEFLVFIRGCSRSWRLKFATEKKKISFRVFRFVMCMKPTAGYCKMMTTTVWACVLAVLCATFVKGARHKLHNHTVKSRYDEYHNLKCTPLSVCMSHV